MISNIPLEITLGSFSIVGILTGYVWNNQSGRIRELENEQKKCLLPYVRSDIAIIKTEIIWIKDNLRKRNR